METRIGMKSLYPTKLLKEKADALLERAGICVNGSQPWDIQVHQEDFYRRVFSQGVLGLGESYMDQCWDCEALDEFFDRVLRADLQNEKSFSTASFLKKLFYKTINFQTRRRALKVPRQHYDLGNDLFQKMLGEYMNYSCAYWQGLENLDEAQLRKMAMICEKLRLKPGLTLLDIGCGFGTLAKYAAQHYKVRVVGVTNSQEQHRFAQKQCAGLPIEIRLQDYRDLSESFDRIVSVGMFEHVGHLNYRRYMQVASQALKDDGLFLLHTIGSSSSSVNTDPWIEKYIFPRSMLPSIAQIGLASEGYFVMEDWHNFGADYDKTLMAWYDNFNHHWQDLKKEYDERFYRMWTYYLLCCAGSFRARYNQLWQIVFSKQGLRGGYQRPAC